MGKSLLVTFNGEPELREVFFVSDLNRSTQNPMSTVNSSHLIFRTKMKNLASLRLLNLKVASGRIGNSGKL